MGDATRAVDVALATGRSGRSGGSHRPAASASTPRSRPPWQIASGMAARPGRLPAHDPGGAPTLRESADSADGRRRDDEPFRALRGHRERRVLRRWHADRARRERRRRGARRVHRRRHVARSPRCGSSRTCTAAPTSTTRRSNMHRRHRRGRWRTPTPASTSTASRSAACRCAVERSVVGRLAVAFPALGFGDGR